MQAYSIITEKKRKEKHAERNSSGCINVNDFLAVYFKGGNIGKSVGVITDK